MAGVDSGSRTAGRPGRAAGSLVVEVREHAREPVAEMRTLRDEYRQWWAAHHNDPVTLP